VSLAELYRAIERHPRTDKAKFWEAKVRQVLECSDEFVRVGSGVWSLASKHTAPEIRKLDALRRERYPRQ
jgi:hypothetical protein